MRPLTLLLIMSVLTAPALLAPGAEARSPSRTAESSTARLSLPLARPLPQGTALRVLVARGASDVRVGRAKARVAPGGRRALVLLPLRDDRLDEEEERFVVRVVAGGRVAARGALLVRDDDPPPGLRLRADTVHEGSPAAVTVALGRASGRTVRVDLAFRPRTIDAGELSARTARAVVRPGATSASVALPVLDDEVFEGQERFAVAVTRASGARVLTRSAEVAVEDDEPQPALVIGAVRVSEGAGTAVVTARLTGPSQVPLARGWATDGTPSARGSFRIGAGIDEGRIVVPIRDDDIDEDDQRVVVRQDFAVGYTRPSSTTIPAALPVAGSVTVVDDDPAPTVLVSDVTVAGDAKGASFSLRLSHPTRKPVSVSATTRDGSAIAGACGSGADYVALVPTGVDLRPVLRATVAVQVCGEPSSEDRAFALVLSDPVNVDLGDGVATATIAAG